MINTNLENFNCLINKAKWFYIYLIYSSLKKFIPISSLRLKLAIPGSSAYLFYKEIKIFFVNYFPLFYFNVTVIFGLGDKNIELNLRLWKKYLWDKK